MNFRKACRVYKSTNNCSAVFTLQKTAAGSDNGLSRNVFIIGQFLKT